MKKISKNQDQTRLINFRLRLTDLAQLDQYCIENGMTRTAGLESLIHPLPPLPPCAHTWIHLEDETRICYKCKATASADQGIKG
jgi:hypothetical protein